MKSFQPHITRTPVRRCWPALLTTTVCALLLLQGCGGGSGGGDVANPAPNPGGNPGTGNPTVPPPTEPPVIGNSPDSLTVTVRQPAFFQVRGGPATYQWQRNGVDIPGATQSAYRFVAQPADAGAQYRVVLRNAAGSVTSQPALLTVLGAPTGDLSLLAGSTGGSGNLDGVGASARFNEPLGLAVAASGDLLVADGGLRRVTPDGSASRVEAFSYPDATDVAVDRAGNGYVVTNGRFPALVRIAPDGGFTSIAELRPTAAQAHIALDSAGNVIVAYDSERQLLRVDPASGRQTVLFGPADAFPGAASPPPGYRGACDVVVDASDNIVFTDAIANTVSRFGPDGITLLVPASAGLLRPCGLAFDRSGNLLIADSGNRAIRKVLPGGGLSTIAGAIGSGAGMQDGTAAEARFTQPTTLAAGPDGTVYIGDNHTVRRLDTSGNVKTIAGLAAPLEPAFGRYHATDAAGNVYVAQPTPFTPGAPYLLQKIMPAGNTTMLAFGLSDPQGIALDDAGNVYIADLRADCSGGTQTNCNRYGLLLKVNAAQGQLSVLAGSSRPASGPDDYDVDGVGTAARFGQTLNDVAVDAAGNVYVGQASMIRKVAPDGTVTTLTDKTGAYGLAVDRRNGNVYAASCSMPAAHVVLAQLSRIDSAGTVTSLSGPYQPDRQDYLTNQTGNCGSGLAVDTEGNLFIAYPGLHTVRKLTPDGTSTTVVGRPDQAGIAPGPLPASLLAPTDLSIDGAGNLTIGSTQAILKARFNE